MKNYRKSLILSVVVLCVLTACSEEKKQTSVVEEKPQVRLETVNVQSVDQTQEFTATVEANVVNNISPSMVLRIDKILVEVGDRVKAGQLLAEMDRSNLIQSKPNSIISSSNTIVSWPCMRWEERRNSSSMPNRPSSMWLALLMKI